MHHCTCNHALSTDPQFADDGFTQAALVERRARAAHAHASAAILAGLAGLVLFGLGRMLFGRRS